MKTGSFLPKGLEWQDGKTAATIAFINEANKYMVNLPRTARIVALEQYVENLKTGKEVLNDWLSIETLFNNEPYKSMG